MIIKGKSGRGNNILPVGSAGEEEVLTAAGICVVAIEKIVNMTRDMENLFFRLGGVTDEGNKTSDTKPADGSGRTASLVEVVEAIPMVVNECASVMIDKIKSIQGMLHGRDDIGIDAPCAESPPVSPNPSKTEKILNSYDSLNKAVNSLGILTALLIGDVAVPSDEEGLGISPPQMSYVIRYFPTQCSKWVKEADIYIQALHKGLL